MKNFWRRLIYFLSKTRRINFSGFRHNQQLFLVLIGSRKKPFLTFSVSIWNFLIVSSLISHINKLLIYKNTEKEHIVRLLDRYLYTSIVMCSHPTDLWLKGWILFAEKYFVQDPDSNSGHLNHFKTASDWICRFLSPLSHPAKGRLHSTIDDPYAFGLPI